MQVASNMTPQQKAIYEAHIAKRAALQAENQVLEQQKQQRIADAKARWDAVKLAEIHTATKEEGYICESCGKPIPKGTKYRRQKIPVGYGFIEGTHYTQRITHVVCAMGGKA